MWPGCRVFSPFCVCNSRTFLAPSSRPCTSEVLRKGSLNPAELKSHFSQFHPAPTCSVPFQEIQELTMTTLATCRKHRHQQIKCKGSFSHVSPRRTIYIIFTAATVCSSFSHGFRLHSWPCSDRRAAHRVIPTWSLSCRESLCPLPHRPWPSLCASALMREPHTDGLFQSSKPQINSVLLASCLA